jgi:hypothetical protein
MELLGHIFFTAEFTENTEKNQNNNVTRIAGLPLVSSDEMAIW